MDDEMLNRFYNALDPCAAVLDYLNKGKMPVPPIPPPVIVVPPQPVDNPSPQSTVIPMPTTTPIPTSTPVLVGDNTEQQSTSRDILNLRIDEVTEPTAYLWIKQVFIRNDEIYVLEKGEEQQIQTPTGTKHTPILFTLHDVLIMAYLLETSENELSIRLVNLDLEDTPTIELVLPKDIIVNTDSKIAFYNSFFVFGGIETTTGNNHIYRIIMTRDSTGEAEILIPNATDPTPLLGLASFIFSRQGNPADAKFNGSIFIYTSQGISSIALDEGLRLQCSNPVTEYVSRDWRFWFTCLNDDQWVLYRNSLKGTVDGDITPRLMDNVNISINNIALAETTGDLYMDDGNVIYLYTMRQNGRELIQRINGYQMFTLR